MHAIIKMLHLTSRRSTELLVQGNDVLSRAQYGVRRSDIIQIPRTLFGSNVGEPAQAGHSSFSPPVIGVWLVKNISPCRQRSHDARLTRRSQARSGIPVSL